MPFIQITKTIGTKFIKGEIRSLTKESIKQLEASAGEFSRWGVVCEEQDPDKMESKIRETRNKEKYKKQGHTLIKNKIPPQGQSTREAAAAQ